MELNPTYRETWLHRVNPSFKLVSFLVLFVLVLFTHNPNVLVNATVVLIVLFALGTGYPPRFLMLCALPVVLLFASSVTSMMFYGKGETTWFRWGLVHITEESFYRGLHIGFKSVDFALMGLLFALTTRPVRLFYSLMQQCGLPAKYAYSFMAAVRLIPMMADEFQTLRHALTVRGVWRRKSFYGKLKACAIPLLAQSIRRAQRIAVAMEAKRFAQAGRRTYYYEIGFSRTDLVFLFGAVALAVASYRLGTAFPYFDVTDVRYNGS